MKIGMGGSLKLEEFAAQGTNVDRKGSGWWGAGGERLREEGVVWERFVLRGLGGGGGGWVGGGGVVGSRSSGLLITLPRNRRSGEPSPPRWRGSGRRLL